MIRLERLDLSDAARQRLEVRSAELCELIENGADVPNRLQNYYRTATEIKPRLRESSHGKCMYCESEVSHVYFGDVEHVLPVHHFPASRLTYSNLGYCCAICNNNKLDHYDPNVTLIDPYSDDPIAHLDASGPSLRPLTARGEATIGILELESAKLDPASAREL